MAKRIIQAPAAPAPIGPYNQAVSVNQLVFLSGQIPIETATGQICAGGVKEQTELVITHIRAILAKAGSSLDQVVKATVFLKNMADFPLMNEIYSKHFKSENAPARSTIEVARLPKDVLVEIEVVATLE